MADDHPSPPASKEILVFSIRRESQCEECGGELLPGDWLTLYRDKPLCMDCADLGHLEFLPRGNNALTRRTTKYSTLKAVVVRWSTTRKRYERQGILAEPRAIARAEEECLADAELREKRRAQNAIRLAEQDERFVAQFTDAIRRQFPACPREEAQSIALHACEKHSRRVGRSAAAKQLDADAIHLAVVAHIRHAHTHYDSLLAKQWDRHEARDAVRPTISAILRTWQSPASA